MLSKLSVIALLAVTTFGSAIPADNQNSVSKRQDEDWNIWFVHALDAHSHLPSRAWNFSAFSNFLAQEGQPLHLRL
jgi:hypothetical protein